MSVTVESLELEVRASSHAAVSGLDALSASLTRLKTAAHGGLGLRAVTAQLGALNGALSALNGTGKLAGLADSLQRLSACGNLKLSSTVAAQIQNIGAAVRTLDGTNFGALTSLAGSLAPLSSLGRANLNSFISQLQRLPRAIAALNAVDLAGTGARIRELAAALAPLSGMGKNNLTSFVTQLRRLPEAVAALHSVDLAGLAARIRALASAFAPLGAQMQSIAAGLSALPGGSRA